jgi:hypothetical protein
MGSSAVSKQCGSWPPKNYKCISKSGRVGGIQLPQEYKRHISKQIINIYDLFNVLPFSDHNIVNI